MITDNNNQVKIEINEEVAESYRKAIARLLVEHPETRKELVKEIRKQISIARNTVVSKIRSELPNDPRKASKAVKRGIYRKVLGGNVSILGRSKAGARYQLVYQRKLVPGQRGGNRRPVSERTFKLATYFGPDRGFVLRFHNAGTVERHIKPMGNRSSAPDGNRGGGNFGNRGQLPARGIFERPAMQAMDKASQYISEAMVQIFEEAFNEELG